MFLAWIKTKGLRYLYSTFVLYHYIKLISDKLISQHRRIFPFSNENTVEVKAYETKIHEVF
jgi:hypothetical protein